AIVITGAGAGGAAVPVAGVQRPPLNDDKAAFCAGGDLGGGLAGDGFFAQHQERGGFADLLLTMRNLGKPTVAAVNGLAMGGGFGLVLA
ncbi:hypothetical protein H6B14_15855, partial [Phocaeicola coprophilus]|nr:hypothetical protein [Phocaeicola coprophilus]